MQADLIKVGIIGCGNISGIYLQNIRRFSFLNLVACADLIPARAQAKAAEFPGVKACSVSELLADPEISVVVNLTTPNAHAEVGAAVIAAGKSLYNEKPLTISCEDGGKLLQTANAKNLRVGSAPDTFFGGSHQTCRKLIDDGWIGQPIGATAFMLCHGHESWHPDPEFYYKPGGGPMFDMGPYYLTALVHLMGPVKNVSGATRLTFPERLITSQPKYGTRVTVEVPTHVVGVLEFVNGAVGTIITSFDVWASELPCIEVYGTEGSLSVPDPNGFGGVVRIRRTRAKEWTAVPPTHGYLENSRGVGVADLALRLKSGGSHRASGELAYHVLEIMHRIHIAADTGKSVALKSTCSRPLPLPLGLLDFTLDA
ncbi:Gfo/Idh/MocA family oxidoreductase [candidate division KSB1 bacterium]|nr:Gfo/Idh/MocA family oxidoreductase [candidate division KSB1 bacterium]